jgi:Glyoxalase-like domain
MQIELDHLFICTAPGAPEADALLRLGLNEATPNQHPGQGTANRRFSFANAMIELFWVTDPAEAQSEATRRTQLYDRWSHRNSGASPFGFCLRPTAPIGLIDTPAPFPAWHYRPAYLPAAQFMEIADTSIEEPMWVYLSFMQRHHREQLFVQHPVGLREITALTLTSPVPLRSQAAQAAIENKILSTRQGPQSLLEVEFDGARRNQTVDLTPRLPLVFRF